MASIARNEAIDLLHIPESEGLGSAAYEVFKRVGGAIVGGDGEAVGVGDDVSVDYGDTSGQVREAYRVVITIGSDLALWPQAVDRVRFRGADWVIRNISYGSLRSATLVVARI